MTEKVTEYFDVLIVGAGISGIGGAYHLTKQCSDARFVVIETQERDSKPVSAFWSVVFVISALGMIHWH